MNSTSAPPKDTRRLAYLTEPLLPLLVKTSIPTIIGMLFMVMYNLTDTFFVGLLNTKSMTAAIGVVFSFVSIIQAIGFWFGYGSGNRMAKKMGEKEDKEAERISSLGLVFSIVTGLLMTLVSWIFVVPLSKGLGGNASKQLLVYTVEYLNVIIGCIPFSLYSITLYNQLRLCGQVKEGTMGLLLGMLSNMILDPVFMFIFKFGFIGAGYATFMGQVIASISLTIIAKRKENSPVGLNPALLHPALFNKERIYHILVGGMPNFSRQSITSISLILLHRVAARYGEGLIAALTISSKVTAFAFLMMIGWAQGFQPICAMNYGAKKYDRIKSAFTWTVAVGTSFLILAAVLLYLFSEGFIGTMTKDGDVISVGMDILRMQCISLPLLSYVAVSSMFMQNIGQYFGSLIISISRQGLFYIPLLYFLTYVYGVRGIILLQPICDGLSFILAGIVLRKNTPLIVNEGGKE